MLFLKIGKFILFKGKRNLHLTKISQNKTNNLRTRLCQWKHLRLRRSISESPDFSQTDNRNTNKKRQEIKKDKWILKYWSILDPPIRYFNILCERPFISQQSCACFWYYLHFFHLYKKHKWAYFIWSLCQFLFHVDRLRNYKDMSHKPRFLALTIVTTIEFLPQC